MPGKHGEAGDPARRVSAVADDLAGYHRRYEANRDARAVFAYAYFNLTLDLADRLAGADVFDDPTWVADLAVAFASRYRHAMDALDELQPADGSGSAGGDSWRKRFPDRGPTSIGRSVATVPRCSKTSCSPWAPTSPTISRTRCSRWVPTLTVSPTITG